MALVALEEAPSELEIPGTDLGPLPEGRRPEERGEAWLQVQRVWRSTRQWARAHRRSLVVVAGLLLVVGIVHGVGMNADPAPVDDEGTYMAEAWAVVMRHALTPYTYWYDHPPLGWLVLGGWAWLTHGFRAAQSALVSGRQMALVAQLVSAALLYGIGRRLQLNRAWSAALVLVWSLSPLELIYGRMAYLDNLAVPWMLASFFLALSPRRNLWALSASGVLFAAAVLSKETVLVFLPALLWQVWQQTGRRTRSFCITGFLASFLLVLVVYPLYALLKGELWPGPGHVSLYQAIVFQLGGRQSSGSPLSAHSQAHVLVSGWLAADPWLLGAGVVLLPVGLMVRTLRPLAVGMLIGVLVALHGGYLPQPYVITVMPWAALTAVGVAGWCWSDLADRLGTARRVRRRPGWSAAFSRRVARALVAVAVGVVALMAFPSWAHADATAMTSDYWTPYHQAEAWLETRVPHRDRLLIDDTMWADLEDHGFNRHLNVVWFYKLGSSNNLDPSVERALPGGWKDFVYVVVTPSIRGAISTDPSGETEVSDAIAHSSAVVRFGSGSNQIVIRRIDAEGAQSDSTAS